MTAPSVTQPQPQQTTPQTTPQTNQVTTTQSQGQQSTNQNQLSTNVAVQATTLPIVQGKYIPYIVLCVTPTGDCGQVRVIYLDSRFREGFKKSESK